MQYKTVRTQQLITFYAVLSLTHLTSNTQEQNEINNLIAELFLHFFISYRDRHLLCFLTSTSISILELPPLISTYLPHHNL
ncbi:hypothetical protein BcDW1_9262 [Botrytis cinerea BcDW1]|uniref:Uncharacterized protein n=1 Tax=Botryotinia fuckeliana (strain BcDW1) TaxID=1290391 RepID=M7TF56_BOTF1|nr:hypothetical protein BcDW1_9262 [Botrytis cinerea BcDW1]